LITKEKIMSAFFKTEVNAYNLYSVNDPHRHYIWGSVDQEETLGERVAAAAAFLSCIATLILIWGAF
jgi:hypothetical protein